MILIPTFWLRLLLLRALFLSLCLFFAVSRFQKSDNVFKLSGKDGVYVGPAGEPLWNGKLPEKVNDYTKPRYVYENLVETTICQPENGRIIGYRISPNLVIHSRIQQVSPSSVALYRDRLGGKLLEFSDVRILATAWQEISDLRVAAGDKPLEGKSIYATHLGSVVVCNIDAMTWDHPDSTSLKEHLLILKR